MKDVMALAVVVDRLVNAFTLKSAHEVTDDRAQADRGHAFALGKPLRDVPAQRFPDLLLGHRVYLFDDDATGISLPQGVSSERETAVRELGRR
jgi:hypothetical protein